MLAVGCLVIVTAGVGLYLVSLEPPSPPTRSRDEPAPAFDLTRLDDERATIALADFAGEPLVLNFWASWCVPCRTEMPAYQQVFDEVGDRVRFLGVNVRDRRDDGLAFAADAGVRYPSIFDPQATMTADYDVFGLPTTIFIDERGRIVAQRTGELSAEDLRTTIDRLFGE